MTGPSDRPAALLSARLFGSPEIRIGDSLLPAGVWPRRSARSLLLLLLGTPGQQRRRDDVIDALWLGLTADAALNELYKAMHALRRVLEPDLQRGAESRYIRTANETIAIRPDVIGEIDVVAFERALWQAEGSGDPRANLRQAIDLYAGDFLADDPYADWPRARRELLRADWHQAVLDLAELNRADGNAGASRAALVALVTADPTDEPAHRALIRLYCATGRFDAARRQFAACVEALRRELDVEPDPETLALFQAIPQSPVAHQSPAPFAPAPVPPTRLVGRTAELEEIQDLLMSDGVRLVTLTGPGGIGKTHLALAVCAALEGEFHDGVAFAGLAAIRDPAEVISELGRALGVTETINADLPATIAKSIEGRDVLLVADNFEQVIDAAPALADLLARAPGLHMLCTSRERLHLRGERLVEIGPLPVPDPDKQPSVQAIARSDAVQLYQERVRDRWREFAVTTENAMTIAGICHRLDGIPLAIELVAAQSGALSLTKNSDRLERRLDLLVDGPRDLPDRLRTMRNAIAWSYELLTEDERRLEMLLSIFSDGATEDAIEQLLRHLGNGHLAIDALLPSLVAKSLLRLDPLSDPSRYRMLETVGEFGIEQLRAAGDFERASAAHCAVYAELLEDFDARLTGDDQIWWFEWTQAEHRNILLAIEHAVAHRQAERALAMAGALWRFWSSHGYGREGLGWLERALAIDSGSMTAARAAALRAAGRLAEDLTDYDNAERHQRAALDAWIVLGDLTGQAIACDDLGSLAHNRGDFAEADALHLEALKLGREADYTRVIMSSLSNLGASAWRRGDHARALDYYSQASEHVTDPLSIALLTSNRSIAAHGLGRVDEALELAEHSLRLWKEVGSKRGIADSLLNIADPKQRLGEREDAKRYASEALAIYEEIGERYGVLGALRTLAVTARLGGDPEHARELLRRALAIATEISDRASTLTLLDDFALTALALGDHSGAIETAAAAEWLRIDLDARRGHFEQLERDDLIARISFEPGGITPLISLDDLIQRLLT